MLQTTRWRPDTCGCVLEYQWDDSVPLNERQLTASKIVKACPAHQKITKVADHYQTVLLENTKKNLLIKNIIENNPDIVDVTINENGETIRKLKAGKDIVCKYDEKDITRTLSVELVGFTEIEKTAVTNLAKTDAKISIVTKA